MVELEVCADSGLQMLSLESIEQKNEMDVCVFSFGLIDIGSALRYGC